MDINNKSPWNKLFWGALGAIAIGLGGFLLLAETTKPTDAKVFGIYRTQDNGDVCITPAEKNESFVTSQAQELIWTLDDIESINKFKAAISLIYGIPQEDIVDFDMQEVYISSNRAGDVYVVLYLKGCQSMNAIGEPVSFWLSRAEFDNILFVAGLLVPAPTHITNGYEPEVITDPRLNKEI